VRVTSSSAGLNSESVCGSPSVCECHGSKDIPQSVRHAESAHKLPECVLGSYGTGLCEAPSQRVSGLNMCSCRFRPPRTFSSIRGCFLIREAFALHAGRLQIPAAESAACGLGVNDAAVGDTTVVRTKFHDHDRRRLPCGNPASVLPA
jgi:hypothetical protein